MTDKNIPASNIKPLTDEDIKFATFAFTCALCFNEAMYGILCREHDDMRLQAASIDRIMSGTGLTYSNADNFSQENFVRWMNEDNDLPH